MLQSKFRGDRENTARPVVVDTPDRLQPMMAEQMSKPECIQVDVFLHQPTMSMQRVEEWRSRASILPTKDKATAQPAAASETPTSIAEDRSVSSQDRVSERPAERKKGVA
jgi:hypothetical protein